MRGTGYPVDSGSPNGLWWRGFRLLFESTIARVSGWCDCDCLLGKAVEEFSSAARLAAVEAEGKFVEILLEVVDADCSLMSSEQPPLQQGGHSVGARQQFGRLLRSALDQSDPMPVSVVRDGGVPSPTVGVEEAAGLDTVFYEGQQAGSRGVRSEERRVGKECRSR